MRILALKISIGICCLSMFQEETVTSLKVVVMHDNIIVIDAINTGFK